LREKIKILLQNICLILTWEDNSCWGDNTLFTLFLFFRKEIEKNEETPLKKILIEIFDIIQLYSKRKIQSNNLKSQLTEARKKISNLYPQFVYGNFNSCSEFTSLLLKKLNLNYFKYIAICSNCNTQTELENNFFLAIENLFLTLLKCNKCSKIKNLSNYEELTTTDIYSHKILVKEIPKKILIPFYAGIENFPENILIPTVNDENLPYISLFSVRHINDNHFISHFKQNNEYFMYDDMLKKKQIIKQNNWPKDNTVYTVYYFDYSKISPLTNFHLLPKKQKKIITISLHYFELLFKNKIINFRIGRNIKEKIFILLLKMNFKIKVNDILSIPQK
jgi:hypothetical protein